jgi:hypothetical protein
MAVALQVTDDGLDGAAASPFVANGGRDAALLAGDEHPGFVGVVAAVAAVDIGPLDFDAGDLLGLGNLGGQVWPSYGFPGRARAPRTNWPPGATALVVAIETFTPNSERAWALPLPMHSTSGACRE